MSCISLRLPPPRKAWKSFTSSFGKLRKIHKSKAMKKPRKHLKNNTTTPATSSTRASKFLVTKRFRNKRLTRITSVIYSFHKSKKPGPVYIDKLFKEPACDFVGHLKPPQIIPQNPRIEKLAAKLPHQPKEEESAGTSKGDDGSEKPCCTSESDYLWESVAIGSPDLTQGINERAEEFIFRFRQEMVAQENMLARNNI